MKSNAPLRWIAAEAALVAGAFLASLGCATAAFAQGGAPVAEYPPKETLEASILRGDIAYQGYCALCHGVHADGRGRAARLYHPRPANLRTSRKSDAYKEAIVRRGGRAMGRSQYMPPWGDELTDEQVADLVNYLRSIVSPEESK